MTPTRGPDEGGRLLRSLRRLEAYDHAVFGSVARLSVPVLDEPLRRVSDFANFSKPWFLTAGAPLRRWLRQWRFHLPLLGPLLFLLCQELDEIPLVEESQGEENEAQLTRQAV